MPCHVRTCTTFAFVLPDRLFVPLLFCAPERVRAVLPKVLPDLPARLRLVRRRRTTPPKPHDKYPTVPTRIIITF